VSSTALRERVLELLLQQCGSFVPAADISLAAGIPPDEIQEIIALLKDQGLAISSSAARGYCLREIPDRLMPPVLQQGLATARAGREIRYFPRIDSTNRIARDLASRGAPDGTLVIAEEQTGGRGRMDRTWVSSPYRSILCSTIWYPGISPAALFRLTMLASVAVVRAVDAVCHIAAHIKWPNDVYIGSRKVCGVLTEFEADGDRVRYAVVGMGINVNEDFTGSPELAGIATSLKTECGRTVSRRELLQQLLVELDQGYDLLLQGGSAELKARWEEHCMILDRQVSIISGHDRIDGIARGITDDGHLLLEDVRGALQEIISGDVSLRM
jgi:BirA family biotin operon repressor/biotin-[acetyl-CoA-carboxylase] ligase